MMRWNIVGISRIDQRIAANNDFNLTYLGVTVLAYATTAPPKTQVKSAFYPLANARTAHLQHARAIRGAESVDYEVYVRIDADFIEEIQLGYKEHPSLDLAIADESKIFRYSSLEKLLAVLQSEALYFTRLSAMQDIYEGKLTHATKAKWLENAGDRREEVEHTIAQIEELSSRHSFVSCWNISEHERDLLWGKFSNLESGVCMVSSIGRLKRAFQKTTKDIYIGTVKYRDFSTHVMTDMNMFSFGTVKNVYFRDESELRAFCSIDTDDYGANVPISVAELLEAVIVSPRAPNWVFSVIERAVAGYFPEVKVRMSEIRYNGSGTS